MDVMSLNQVPRPQPLGGNEDFILDEGKPERTVKVGQSLDEHVGVSIRKLLREFKDVFAFEVDEMPGIDTSLAVHKLNVDSNSKPVRQKKRNLGEARNKAAAEEVIKLMDAGFIRQCYYPNWVANIVLFTKPNGSWRMCVDYTDLNKHVQRTASLF